MATPQYEGLMRQITAALPPGKLWCVIDPDGKPLLGTAHRRADRAIEIFCRALDVDWEEAKVEDFVLGQCDEKPA